MAIEKPKAKERLSPGTNQHTPKEVAGNFPETSKPSGEVRDIIGETIGVSGRTASRLPSACHPGRCSNRLRVRCVRSHILSSESVRWPGKAYPRCCWRAGSLSFSSGSLIIAVQHGAKSCRLQLLGYKTRCFEGFLENSQSHFR